MSRREAWASAAVVFAVALVIRVIAAAAVGFPVPEDTAYYAGVARNVVEGRGLISDGLWSYQTQPLTVPRAAFEVWMPLPSLLAAVPMAILGTANWLRSAQVVSVLAGSGIAVLAWRLGADVAAELRLPAGRARTMGVGAGLVASLLGPLVLYAALPDSTALFAVLALAACLLMTRVASRSGPGATTPVPSRQLVALGVILGLAALTRSEAVWLGMAWLAIVWRGLPTRTLERAPAPVPAERAATLPSFRRFERLRLALTPGLVAVLVFVPWAVRDWLTFGSPLPGQTINNALYVSQFDVFAYRDQPSLAGYLSQGPLSIIGMHVDGLVHNLLNVLVIPAFPIGVIGLLMLPRVWRLTSLRPLVLTAFMTFAVTSLVFPVSTQSGTFLHSAGAVLVLLIVSCLAALDTLIVWVGRVRHWTRPVAWLGPAFAIAVVIPITTVSVSAISRQADEVRSRYEALPAAMTRAGVPLGEAGPVITNYPIWLAESARIRTLALPEEQPDSVLDLAHRFGATLLVIQKDDLRQWPGILDRDTAAAPCFEEVSLTDATGGKVSESSPLAQMRVFRIVCP